MASNNFLVQAEESLKKKQIEMEVSKKKFQEQNTEFQNQMNTFLSINDKILKKRKRSKDSTKKSPPKNFSQECQRKRSN
mgnify:CR=1 FL=1